MIVHVDTSALIDALTGPRRSLDALIALTDEGHRLMLSTIVLYEWLRGPRLRSELTAQEELFPLCRSVLRKQRWRRASTNRCRARADVRSTSRSRPARSPAAPRSGR